VDTAFEFTRQGREPRTVVVLILVYSVLLAAIIAIDAAWWLMAALALLTLPALWDLWKDPSAGLRLDRQRLDWHSGRLNGTLVLSEIDYMRFDTRWDFSVRVTAVLNTAKRIRLPDEALPSHRAFEAALDARGIRVERHYFTVF
jgi:hypothetical protein